MCAYPSYVFASIIDVCTYPKMCIYQLIRTHTKIVGLIRTHTMIVDLYIRPHACKHTHTLGISHRTTPDDTHTHYDSRSDTPPPQPPSQRPPTPSPSLLPSRAPIDGDHVLVQKNKFSKIRGPVSLLHKATTERLTFENLNRLSYRRRK